MTPSRAWQHTHNDLHHTWTNVVGKDRDVGYTILRMDEDQEWTPRNLGNLSLQLEHHLFPDLPSNRYAEVAVKMREICARYELPYTTEPLPKQVASAWAKVFRLALP